MILRFTLLIASILLNAAPAWAQTPEQKGLRIAKEASDRDEGFKSSTATGNMILRDRQGNESVRHFKVKTLEVEGDGDKSLIIFDRPRDIRDTSLLTYSHKEDDDDQWLYLPALRRVKRISSSNQSGSFVGSEFSYEDLVSPEVEKFTYKWLRDEPCPGKEEFVCYVNERYPTSRDSGYTREVVWIDQEHYRVFKIDYFDRKKTLLKTLTVDNYQQYKDQYWRPDNMLMTNRQNGKSTVMQWRDYDFSANLSETDLSRRALERVR